MSQTSGEPAAPAESPAGEPNDGLSLEKHQKLLDEKKKEKARADALAARLKEYEDKEKLKEEEDAKKRGDFETILKSREEEIAKLKSEVTSYRDTITYSQKMNAVLDAVGTKVEDKWLKLIDADKVVINPSTGEIDQASVNKLVENLKKDWPEMIRMKHGALPSDAPKGNDAGSIKRSEWEKLPTKEMRKYRPDQVID